MAKKQQPEPIKVETLAERWKQRREGAGITQQQLSELTGIAQSHLSQIEGGRRMPSIAKLQAVAKALGVRAGDLLPDAA